MTTWVFRGRRGLRGKGKPKPYSYNSRRWTFAGQKRSCKDCKESLYRVEFYTFNLTKPDGKVYKITSSRCKECYNKYNRGLQARKNRWRAAWPIEWIFKKGS